MSAAQRRYDIDWLRVIAIGLLLVYHIGIVFQPWGVFIGFIQSDQPLESLWAPMSLLNIWRIPLLFFVSGMGVCFSIRKRDWKQLLLERIRRILIPFIFGMLAIVPLHLFIWQGYYSQELKYYPGPGHLWFLGNIFIYVILFSPLLFHLKRNMEGKVIGFLRKLFSNPLGLLLVAGFFSLEAILVNPETYATFALTWHGLFTGGLAFFFGFICILSGTVFWQTVMKWRLPLLALAASLFTVRLWIFELEAPNFLIAIESVMWIFSVFGFGYRYLNRPGKALTYLGQGAYPIYILHMIFLYLGSSLILPLEIPAYAEITGIILFTFAGCFVSYEYIIRRIGILRPLFGLKPVRSTSVSDLQPNIEVYSETL